MWGRPVGVGGADLLLSCSEPPVLQERVGADSDLLKHIRICSDPELILWEKSSEITFEL